MLSYAKYKSINGNISNAYQRLAIALAQVKVDNTSENVLNEIRSIIYSLYRAK